MSSCSVIQSHRREGPTFSRPFLYLLPDSLGTCRHGWRMVVIFYQEWPLRHSQWLKVLLVSCQLNNNHEMAKIWDLTRKCPGFSWKHHVLLRLSQQASLHSPGGCRSPFAKYGPPLPCNAQNPPLLLQCQPRFRLCDKGSFHRRRVSPEFD